MTVTYTLVTLPADLLSRSTTEAPDIFLLVRTDESGSRAVMTGDKDAIEAAIAFTNEQLGRPGPTR